MEKLTAKEKVGIWCLLLMARLMIKNWDLSEDTKKLVDGITHELRYNV